jgi:hypothetical protein
VRLDKLKQLLANVSLPSVDPSEGQATMLPAP